MKPAFYILKRREYLGKVFSRFGYKPSYTKWETISAWDTLENAKAGFGIIPASARGMMVHAIFHRGKKIYTP